MSVKAVTVYLCSHTEIEYINCDLDGPVHTFLDCPCSLPECKATDERWFTENEPATPEEFEKKQYLWKQLGNIHNQINSLLTTFNGAKPESVQHLAGTLSKGPHAQVVQLLVSENRAEEIQQRLFEPRDLLKYANQFQHSGRDRTFFEYCLKRATRLLQDAKHEVAELRAAIRGIVPDRVQALRREFTVRSTKGGPRVYVKREPIDSLVLGVKSVRVTKERPIDGLVRGMKGMHVTKDKGVRFRDL